MNSSSPVIPVHHYRSEFSDFYKPSVLRQSMATSLICMIHHIMLSPIQSRGSRGAGVSEKHEVPGSLKTRGVGVSGKHRVLGSLENTGCRGILKLRGPRVSGKHVGLITSRCSGRARASPPERNKVRTREGGGNRG